MAKLAVTDLDLSGKRVLMRCDFNVPLDAEGNITDEKRIVACLPTIRHVLEQGARLVLMSHFGRPKGERKPEFSLAPVAASLSEHLGFEVALVDDLLAPEAEARIDALEPGRVLMLENVRFYPGETKGAPDLSAAIARLGDVFVNDAFGTSHRAHCSVTGVAGHLPTAAGFLVKKELDVFGGILTDPKRPFVAVLGGAKVSDKILVIENLLKTADTIIIGGGMAYTFLKAQGHSIGTSLVEDDRLDVARDVLAKAEAAGVDLLIPEDHVVGDAFAADANVQTTDGADIPDGWMGLDIGPKTIERYTAAVASSATCIWNGPMGVFEMKPFEAGTRAVGEALAASDSISVIGGGDSAAACAKFDLVDRMTHISTGGGASLELLEGKELPGLAALTDT